MNKASKEANEFTLISLLLTIIRLCFLSLVSFRGWSIWRPIHISRRANLILTYDFIQLLNNLFEICWAWIMLTSSVISWRYWFLCNKEMSRNPKKCWKLLKIGNTEREILHVFWTNWGISMKFSGKMWLTIIPKVTKKTGFYTLFRRCKKHRRWRANWSPP